MENLDIERIRNLAISDTGFVFDPVSGHTFTTNRTGFVILGLIKEEKNQGEIAGILSERFEVDEDTALRELQNFVFRIKDLGLGESWIR